MNSSKLLALFAFLFAFSAANAQIITTFAGNGSPTYSGDGGPATAAGIAPHDVAVDNHGNVFIVDRPARIRKIDAAGIISTYAGTGSAGFAGDGGPATAAQISYTNSIMADYRGNIYISDGGNARVRKIDSNGIITTIAGNGTTGFFGDGGPATAAGLNDPYSVFADSANGNIYISDGYNNAIRMINPAGIITTVAGTGTGGYSGDGGPATAAMIDYSTCVWVDVNGVMYFTDDWNNCIRMVDVTGTISTIIGSTTPGYTGDGGPATAATLNTPFSFTIDECGDFYIGDEGNQVIRMVNTAGIISTFAGDGSAGFGGDGGPATAAKIADVSGFAFDKYGYLYLADGTNNRIRRVSNVVPEPGTISGSDTVCIGHTLMLSDTTSGGTWSSTNSGIASVIGSSGVVTGVSGGTDSIKYIVTAYTGCSAAAVFPLITLAVCGDAAVPGVNAGLSASVEIYPNPVSARLSINFPGTKGTCLLQNMLGQVLQQQALQHGANAISVQWLPAGLYLVAVTDEAGNKTVKKISKE